ncbi:MAG: UPF0175 family protein [Thermoanaerobaculia bacterium]|nr:UPF0175 family protein [Thermoanaerobaculia bacterium]
MHVSITVPDDLASQMREQWGDLQRSTLEALAAAAYRRGILTHAQVGRLLGHGSRFETDGFLKSAGAYLDYTENDLRKDLATLAEMSGP